MPSTSSGRKTEGTATGAASPGSAASPRTAHAAAPRSGGPAYFLAVFLIAAAVLMLVQAFVGRMYVVPSASMEPTLHGCAGCSNDRIVVDKLSFHFAKPSAGDVIIFAGPPSWSEGFEVKRSRNVAIRGIQNIAAAGGLISNGENILVKRVIATAGQTVSCEPGDDAVKVDGKAIDQSYIRQPAEIPVSPAVGSQACGGPYFGPVTVPEDSVWVMGDNRTNSLDSRAHLGDEHQGTVPLANVRGKVVAIVLPLSRMSRVERFDIQAA